MLDPKSIIELEEMADKENGWVVPMQEKNRKKELKIFAELVKNDREKKHSK